MAVHISIDELVLHGVTIRDRDAVADALRQAIASHLDASAVKARAATLSGLDRITAADVSVPVGAPPADIGVGAGRAVAQAIGGRGR